jgi:hypothetical protein
VKWEIIVRLSRAFPLNIVLRIFNLLGFELIEVASYPKAQPYNQYSLKNEYCHVPIFNVRI